MTAADLSGLDATLLRRLPGRPSERVAVGLVDAAGKVTPAARGLLAVARTQGQPWLRVRTWSTGHVEVAEGGPLPLEDRWPAGPLALAVEEVAAELAGLAPVDEPVPGAAARLWTEVLVNALGHRDWAAPEDVLVEVTTDRICVWSPGGVPKSVAVSEGGLKGRLSPYPGTMALLTALGLAHQQGRGWSVLPELARSLGYRVAVGVAGQGAEVSLSVDPLRAVAFGPSPGTARRVRVPANVIEEAIVRHLRQVGEASARQIQEALGRPNSTVRAALRRLEDRGVVEAAEDARRSRFQMYGLRGG